MGHGAMPCPCLWRKPQSEACEQTLEQGSKEPCQESCAICRVVRPLAFVGRLEVSLLLINQLYVYNYIYYILSLFFFLDRLDL